MTEYELADLMRATSSDSLVFIPIFLTVISAYLVVAWTVGSKLTRSQVSLVNSIFIISALVFTSSWQVRINSVLQYQAELLIMNPNAVALAQPWLLPAVYTMTLIALVACLKFMWDIRHSKTTAEIFE